MHTLREIFTTYQFIIPFIVISCAEIAQFVSDRVETGFWHRRLFAQGGMPSRHSAFVTSLVVVVGERMGLASTEFAIAMVFAGIVWYDAVVVRRTVAKQGRVLNTLQDFTEFSEEVGHSLVEVLAGIVFGLVLTLILFRIF
ncbi:MAG: divergent PAP2 family protein [Candidatus Peribacteraceae bacterium]